MFVFLFYFVSSFVVVDRICSTESVSQEVEYSQIQTQQIEKQNKMLKSIKNLIQDTKNLFPPIQSHLHFDYINFFSLCPDFFNQESEQEETFFCFNVNYCDYKIVPSLNNSLDVFFSHLGKLEEFYSYLKNFGESVIFLSDFEETSVIKDLPNFFKNSKFKASSFVIPLPSQGFYSKTNYIFYIIQDIAE
jgi:hypothetical protein